MFTKIDIFLQNVWFFEKIVILYLCPQNNLIKKQRMCIMTRLELFAKEEATKIFLNLGIPANLQGFKFLQNCVVKVVEKPNYIKKVTKILYPEVGNMFDVSGAVVERSMRHATDQAYFKTKFKSLGTIFNLDIQEYNCKPTNCELIAIVSEALRFKAEKEGLIN